MKPLALPNLRRKKPALILAFVVSAGMWLALVSIVMTLWENLP